MIGKVFALPREGLVVRSFKKGDGIFQIGVRKTFKIGTEKEQISSLKNDSRIETFKITGKTISATVNLGRKGRYEIEFNSTTPFGWRLDTSRDYMNPFIGSSNHICLGSAQGMFDRMFRRGDYAQCIKIIMSVLVSKDGSGYRRWSDCY